MMGMLFRICLWLSVGIVLGVLGGGIKSALRRKEYSPQQVEATRAFVREIATFLKYCTILCLALGLVWCVYFLVLAILVPGQADYANNMAELIVAVLTVISIIFAFVEFLQHKGNSK